MMTRQKEDLLSSATQVHVRSSKPKALLAGREEFILDPSGTIISTNLDFANVTGYESWELTGKHISIFYNGQDIHDGKVERDLNTARLSKKILTTSWMLKKRRVQFWGRVSIRCLFTKNGIVSGFRFSLKDHTHKLISNQKLERFKNEYRNLFENPFIGIFRIRSIDLRILHFNRKARQIINGQKVKRFDDLFEDLSDFDKILEHLIREKTITAFEFRLKGGINQWVRLDCQLFPSEGFIEGVISDVTESRQQLHQLEKVNADLDNFIYRASHDLRSPLTTLMGLINLVQHDPHVDAEVYYGMMKDRITHLDRLLGDLAAITYNNKTELSVSEVNFNTIAAQLCQAFRNHCIKFQNNEFEGVQFRSDSNRIFTILQKLITHCSYFGRRQGLDDISVEIFKKEKEIVLTLHDSGCSYDPAQLDSLFGLFSKMAGSAEDTGLSMYLAKLLVEKLGGSINVAAHPAGGTQFRITLPCLA